MMYSFTKLPRDAKETGDKLVMVSLQFEEEVAWYERVRRRDFGGIRDLSAPWAPCS